MTNLDDSSWINTSIKEHKEIIDALEKKNGSAVERLMRNHVIHAGKIFTHAELPGRKAGEERFSPFGINKGAKKRRQRAL